VIKCDLGIDITAEAENKSICSKIQNYDLKLLIIQFKNLNERY
jgi:hypothetical protein